jgi:hypothetical protein
MSPTPLIRQTAILFKEMPRRVRGREAETAPTGTSFHELLRVASVATDRESERASKFTRVPASAARLNFVRPTYSTVLWCRARNASATVSKGRIAFEHAVHQPAAELKSESWLYIG